MLFIISEIPVDTRWFSVAETFQIFSSSIEVLLHHRWPWFWVEFYPASLSEGCLWVTLFMVFFMMSHCSYMIPRRDRCHLCRAHVSYSHKYCQYLLCTKWLTYWMVVLHLSNSWDVSFHALSFQITDLLSIRFTYWNKDTQQGYSSLSNWFPRCLGT